MPNPIVQYNVDLANRQIEINEWSYNNKMDTLFVFQIMFMSIVFISILMSLKASGLIGGAFVWYVLFILIVLVALIIINRSMYTSNQRDTTSWNRIHFSDNNTKPSPVGTSDISYQPYLNQIESKYNTGGEGPSSGIKSSTNDAGITKIIYNNNDVKLIYSTGNIANTYKYAANGDIKTTYTNGTTSLVDKDGKAKSSCNC